MKTLVAILVSVACWGVLGQTNTRRPTPQVSEITNNMGRVYRAVRVQQLFDSEVLVSYRRDDGVRDMANIKLVNLPTNMQVFFRYDSNKAAQAEVKLKARSDALSTGTAPSDPDLLKREYWDSVERRTRENEAAIFEAKQRAAVAKAKAEAARREFEDRLKIEAVRAQQEAAAALRENARRP